MIVIVGFIGSLIGIFSFLTGRQSIIDFFPTQVGGKETSVPIVAEQPTRTISTITLTAPALKPELTNTPTPLSTSTQVSEIVEVDYPGLSVKITNYEPNNPEYPIHIILRPIAGDSSNSLVIDKFWHISPVVQDIVGNWQRSDFIANNIRENDDGSTEFFLKSTTIDFVSLVHDGGYITCWADRLYPYPIVPIYEGKTTEVLINFALLELGVVDKDGNAMRKADIDIAYEREELGADGQPILEKCIASRTDEKGIRRMALVGGEYWARVCPSQRCHDWFPPIKIAPGEYKRIIVNDK